MGSNQEYVERLRSADLRVTRPRVAVLEAVHDHPHADTETIFAAVRGGLADVSRQTVYDVLNALTAVGLVRRIQPSGSVARYIILFAITTPGIGAKGISAFIIDTRRPGFHAGKIEPKLGIRASATCEIEFHDYVCPAADMLGKAFEQRIAVKAQMVTQAFDVKS